MRALPVFHSVGVSKGTKKRGLRRVKKIVAVAYDLARVNLCDGGGCSAIAIVPVKRVPGTV